MMERKIINRDKLLSLEVGQIFKSENKLIEYLEITKNNHKGEKERIVEYMNEYVEYESTNNSRCKNEIVITWIENGNVFIEPMNDGKLDTLTGEAMGYMLLNNIKHYGSYERNCVFFSKGFLYREMQMCNERWSEINGNRAEISKLAKEIEIKELDNKKYNGKTLVYEFFDITNSVFNRNLTKGIKWLKNRRLALSYDSYAVCINGEHRLATTEERCALLSMEYEVLKLWHIDYKRIWKEKRYRQFRDQVVKQIKYHIEEDDGTIPSSLADIDYYYEVVEFYFTYKDVLTEMKKIDTITRREAKKVSNDNVKKEIDRRADKMTQRQSKEYKKHMNKLTKDTIKDKPKKDK